MLLQHIINIIESVAPLKWQEAWDNSGLQIGHRDAEIHAVLLTVDITESVVSEAIARHCDLIVSHHPLLFHPLRDITGANTQARCVEMAIRHDIAIYSSHTAIDASPQGVSAKMAQVAGLTDWHILVDGAQCRTPHEYGLGVIGQLPEPVLFSDYVETIKNAFGATYLRYTDPVQSMVQTVACCGGAGAEFTGEAIRQGADVYISADFKYHEMQAADGRIAIIDMDHWVSEHFTRDIFRQLISDYLPTYIAQSDHSIVKSTVNRV